MIKVSTFEPQVLNPKVHIDEAELIVRLKQKDRAALEYLYDHYSAALFGVIIRIVNHQSIAEEILQDVFLKTWNRINQYDNTRGRLFTWLVTLARHQAIDRLRSKEIRMDQKSSPIENIVGSVERKTFTEIYTESIGLSEVLANLSEEQRFVVELVYFKGYSQSEVAEEFNIPLGTVKTRLRQALKQLRTTLGVA